jgi:hypothetical protein
MNTYVAEVNGEAIVAFRAEDDDAAFGIVSDENAGSQLGLYEPTESRCGTENRQSLRARRRQPSTMNGSRFPMPKLTLPQTKSILKRAIVQTISMSI